MQHQHDDQRRQDDQRRIAQAIHAAEAGTSGQIVCVLARTSMNYGDIAMLLAALLALLAPWLLLALTQWSVIHLLLAQLVIFVIAWLLLSIPAISTMLVSGRAKRAAAHRAAAEQFMIRGLSRTSGGTGVLIFVSLAERYARIIADDGIAARIAPKDWQAIVDDLTAHMREHRVGDGFVSAINACGALLAAHFPPGASASNELPDRLYVI